MSLLITTPLQGSTTYSGSNGFVKLDKVWCPVVVKSHACYVGWSVLTGHNFVIVIINSSSSYSSRSSITSGRNKKLHLKNISFILSRNWRHAGRHSYLLREKCLLYENGYSLRITKHNTSFSSRFFSFHLKTFIFNLPCEVNATLKHTVDHFSFR